MTGNLPDLRLQPPTQLLALLDIVGPAETPALLAHLHADLTDCDNQLKAATPTCDWQAIRGASHDLVALAGTAGAKRLQRMAEDLNRIAHAEDRRGLSELAPGVGDELAALCQLIHGLTANRGYR